MTPSVPHDLEFRSAAVDTGDGGVLIEAMRAEMAVLYDGLDLTSAHLPAAGPVELGPPRGGFWVGYRDGVPVSCGGLKDLGADICEIKRMFVVADHRGRGVARATLTHLEQQARARGYRAARLDTGPRQPDAEHLYLSAGYRPIGNFNAHPVASFFGEKAL